MQLGNLPQTRISVVAIPAYNEATYIAGCLAALAVQRDETGAPLDPESLEILIFANNCTDQTASIARELSHSIPYSVKVVEEDLPAPQRNAGWARKCAMDLAAARLAELAPLRGLLLTTDADSRVAPTWLSATLREFQTGADCVAGYIDAIPAEYIKLGGAFLRRGRLEDSYLRYIAEIDARCDPRTHNPWPTHRVSSGASLAVTLAAYSAIGGLPPRHVGEDVALTRALDHAGFRVRHSMDVCVSTSCRLEGRAKGGAAETMCYRHDVPDAPCDDDLEPALAATRRALVKGMLRARWMDGPANRPWPSVLKATNDLTGLFDGKRAYPFAAAWQAVCDRNQLFRFVPQLRPSDLPRQIAIAKMIVRHLRVEADRQKIFPGGRPHPGRLIGQVGLA